MLGKINKVFKGPYGVRKRVTSAIVAFVAAFATLFMGLIVPQAAHAASATGPGYYLLPFTDGSTWLGEHGSMLGVQGWSGGRPVYCIESGVPLGSVDGAWQEATDHTSLVAANMVQRHINDMSNSTQAAVAYAIHDHLDRGNSHWSIYKTKPLDGADINTIAQLAGQFWQDAENSLVSGSRTTQNYIHGKRTGVIDPAIINSAGQYVSGVNFTATDVNNNIKFDATGTNSISGTTIGGPMKIPWTATRNGKAHVVYNYDFTGAQSLASSSQDTFKAMDPSQKQIDGITYDVRRDFQPTVTTQVDSKVLKRGQTVQDHITFGVDQTGDNVGGEWVDSVPVKAKGYYFTGKDKAILEEIAQTGNVLQPEDPNIYLNTVKAKLGNPVATVETTVTGPTTVLVTAKGTNGLDYVNPEDGLFGGWLWIIVKGEQRADIQEFITNNYIDTFGKAQESVNQSHTVNFWSEVAEPHAQQHSDVRDVIHLTNLPKDLGEFKGNDKYGFSADETKAVVRVWWSGASGGNAGVPEEDMKYVPQTPNEPTQDDNHKLIKTVEYDLPSLIKALGPNYNGSLDIKVAGGSNGSPLADGSHFSIPADNTGYYTFVVEYKGCSRVLPFKSNYNDQFESTFVTKTKTIVSLTSQTNPGEVKVGEEFKDIATVVGDNGVTSGAYVSFTAYSPVFGKPNPSVDKLLDNVRVPLSNDQLADLHKGKQIEVSSPSISAQTSGTVYWQAALHATNGTILATHELGIKSESTLVHGGAEISSVAQNQGAVGGPAWDIITVGDKTTGENRGNIPNGSVVRVSLYKHEGQNQATKGQLVASKDFPVDIAKLGDRPGKYSFKADVGTYPAAGQYDWVHQVIAPDGSVLAEGHYGDDTERTPVQEYKTESAKKWMSDNNSEYSDSTIKTYDVMSQHSFTHWGNDLESAEIQGQTASGTKAQFSIWEQGDKLSDDSKIVDGSVFSLPKMPTGNHTFDQKVKSETFTLPTTTKPGTHYYGLRVTNTDDAKNLKDILGIDSDGLVYEAPKRDKAESFEVVKVTSKSSETAWVDTQKHVEETLFFEGNFPAGTPYKVEVWKRGADGTATEKVSESKVLKLDHDITGSGIVKVQLPMLPYGSYQFRHMVWTPDNQGGDTTAQDKSGVIDINWKPSPDDSAGYSNRYILYEGESVPSERFEVINISTDVTGTDNMHTTKDGKHYINATKSVQAGDIVTIKGHIPAGFKIGFELYKQASGNDSSKDTLVDRIDAENLSEGQTKLNSYTLEIKGPGNYYWVTVFQKQDESAWSPDGETVIKSDRRVASESFHAVRVTTQTYKWSSKQGKATDTAIIEGCLPDDATIQFDLHPYGVIREDKVVATTQSKLSDIGYKPCTDGNTTQTVTSNEVTVPDAVDYYWVESVRLPGDELEFHRGDSEVPNESTRSIDAVTNTVTEINEGDALSDHTVFANVKFSSGKTTDDSKYDEVIDPEGDIRDDLVGLKASWDVYKQAAGNDPTKDTLVASIDKDGVPLVSGQKTADSSKYTTKGVGLYYFRVKIIDDKGTVVKYGDPRDLKETFRVINSVSSTTRVVEEGSSQGIVDTVTINGPVAPGTMVTWTAYKKGDDPSKDTPVVKYDTPATGAYVISEKEADVALKAGKYQIQTTRVYKDAKAGDNLYWIHEVYAPQKNEDGTIKKPVKGSDGAYTTDHLVVGKEGKLQPIFVDKARVEAESVNVVKVTTKTAPTAVVGDKIHDTAIIEGDIPNNDYCVSFEYWSQDGSPDISKDKLVTTTDCVPVPAHAREVNSPEITAKDKGIHYFREGLLPHGDKNNPVSYGKPRVPGETVNVKPKPLPQTGAVTGVFVLLSVAFVGIGGVLLYTVRNKSMRGYARHSQH